MPRAYKPATSNSVKTFWDSHGSFKSRYFDDEIKQKIKFYLSQKLSGRNIELGGGWYLSYPGSVVLDLSMACLVRNPSGEKLQFDLDTLDRGAKLPFKDATFDSATMVSVWQYLRYPGHVMSEIERMLKPGAELHLIHGQGAGIDRYIVSHTRTEEMESFLRGLGYDTLVENIPVSDPDMWMYRSLCVAMPSSRRARISMIKDKEAREERNRNILRDPSIFLEAYEAHEFSELKSRLEKLAEVPVTAYALGYLGRVQRFSDEIFDETGQVPYIFSEYVLEEELSMMLPGDQPVNATLYLAGQSSLTTEANLELAMSEHGLKLNPVSRYFEHEGNLRRELLKDGMVRSKSSMARYADFCSAVALNTYTREMQEQLMSHVRLMDEDFEGMVMDQKALVYRLATCETEQERKIDSVISSKERILREKVPITGFRRFDHSKMLPVLRKFIR